MELLCTLAMTVPDTVLTVPDTVLTVSDTVRTIELRERHATG